MINGSERVIKNLELKVAGIVSVGVISLLIFLQVQMMRDSLSAGSSIETIPSYFYGVMDFFCIAIFLLGVGCIFRGMSGVGVIFAAFQISILVALIQGIPPVAIIAGLVLASVMFLDVSQMLIYVSEMGESNIPINETASERSRIDYYLSSVEYSDPDARMKLEYARRSGLTLGWFRTSIVWVTVVITLALAVLLIGDDSMSYVSILFFVIFPLSIMALVTQRRTTDEED